MNAFVFVFLLVLVAPSTAKLKWDKDLTHSLRAGQFIKLGQTILTKFPLFLKPRGTEPEPSFGTLPVAEGIGDREVSGNTLLNSYVGAAHAYCYGLVVESAVEDYSFRVCTATELNALTSVTKVPGNTVVVTYASGDGDDYSLGLLSDEPLRFVQPPDDFTNGRDPSYYGGDPKPGAPPSPPLPTGGQRMQTFSGDEESTDYWKADAYINVVAYCCSGQYTLLNGEGTTG